MYRAHEFAELAGITVRTLHHYDRLGLLKPKRRTAAGYRLYEDRDLERLEQIVALKYLGMSLRQILSLLNGGPLRLQEALGIQRRLLIEKRQMLDRAIQAIGEAERAALAPGETGAALRKIIEVIAMETNNDWMSKYHTEESKAKVEARKHLWSPELQERVSRQWSELIADVEAALGEDPAGEKDQALAARWKELVEGFTGGDPDITASLGRVWADRANWPADMNTKAPVIKPEVWAFISRARAAR
jgi:MerR family transcriptional regulator, thiopeptide resistance regulator